MNNSIGSTWVINWRYRQKSARQCQGESANVQLLRIEENKETLLKTEKLSISEMTGT